MVNEHDSDALMGAPNAVARAGVLAPAWLRLPGFALACVLALAATFVSSMHGGPQMLYALLMGVAFHYLSKDAQTRPGIEFCSRSVLRLGARITASQIAGLGWATAAIVVLAVVSTLLFGHGLPGGWA